MVRRPTRPIPPHLIAPFYAAAWSIAESGTFVDSAGRLVDVRSMRYGIRTARRHAIVLLWLTAAALRFSELRRLRRVDLAPDAMTVFVSRSKRGRSGPVEVERRLVDLTLDWRAESVSPSESVWLIPSATGNQLDNDAYNRDACGLFRQIFDVPLSSHCYRDTACQMAMLQTGRLRTVQHLMGHRSARTTEHYLAKQEADSVRLRLFNPADDIVEKVSA